MFCHSEWSIMQWRIYLKDSSLHFICSEWQNTNKFVNNDWHIYTLLYLEEFDEDRAEMINRAINKGVTEFYLPP